MSGLDPVEKSNSNIADLFKTMNVFNAAFSPSNIAQHWLKVHDNHFVGFVNGVWLPKPETSSTNQVEVPLSNDVTITINFASDSDVEVAVENAIHGYNIWHQYEALKKSKVLYRIAQSIEQQDKLFNSIENLSMNGRLREKQNVSYLIDSFKYFASLVGSAAHSKDYKSIGVVCIIAKDFGANVVSALWRVSALLAAGNAILFLMDCSTNLSAFLLAELCDSAGLPAGLFNVLFCKSSLLKSFPKVDRIIATSLEQKQFLSTISNICVPCEFLLYTLPTVIVYESSDIDAALNSILEIININDTEKALPIYKVFIQESIQDVFMKILSQKISGYTQNNANERVLLYIMCSAVMTSKLNDMLFAYNSYSKIKAICDLRDMCGSGIFLEQFRTVKESIAMFNNDKKGSDVSIWSEEMHLVLEVAHKLKTRTVWINSLNLYDPSVPCGSVYLSGDSVLGGKEGFFSHFSVLNMTSDIIKRDDTSAQLYGEKKPQNIILTGNKEEKRVAKNFKLYIGGYFTNSNDAAVKIAFDSKNKPYAYVASANYADVEKTISSASSSQPKWELFSKIKRSAILHKASEILSKRKEEFASELQNVTGSTKEDCTNELELAIFTLIDWANYLTHFDGHTKETKLYGKVLQEYYPLGLISIQCPDEAPLLSFLFFITPAVIFGNAVVAIASEKYPTAALMMCEVFQAAGLPGGVLNVIAGSRAYLTRQLGSHLNIDAIWFTEDGAKFIYNSCQTIQPKKIFDCRGITHNLSEAYKLKFVFESTYTKAVYIPMGTGFS